MVRSGNWRHRVRMSLSFQCDEDEALVCPTAPPIEIEGGPLAGRILVLILESIGAEGFIGFFGGLFLFLGFMKLSCGGIICCRKTKAQEYADRMKEKGAPPKGRVHTCTTHSHMHTHTYTHVHSYYYLLCCHRLYLASLSVNMSIRLSFYVLIDLTIEFSFGDIGT